MRRLLEFLIGPEVDRLGPLQADLLAAHEEARARSERKVAELRLTREAVALRWAQNVAVLKRLAS